MMVLADTSVWVDHLRHGDDDLAEALEQGYVMTHPFVVGELACGNLRHRARILALLAALPQAPVATDAEVLGLIERRKLMGRGIGYVDAHILASLLLAESMTILTRDRRLGSLWAELLAGR